MAIICIIAGLSLSALGLFRNRRMRRGIRIPLTVLATNVIALVTVAIFAAVAAADIDGLIGGPSIDETARELAEDGLTFNFFGSDDCVRECVWNRRVPA